MHNAIFVSCPERHIGRLLTSRALQDAETPVHHNEDKNKLRRVGAGIVCERKRRGKGENGDVSPTTGTMYLHH